MVTGKRIKNKRLPKNDYQMKMKVYKCHIWCVWVCTFIISYRWQSPEHLVAWQERMIFSKLPLECADPYHHKLERARAEHGILSYPD
jgi:hypothetical protein